MVVVLVVRRRTLERTQSGLSHAAQRWVARHFPESESFEFAGGRLSFHGPLVVLVLILIEMLFAAHEPPGCEYSICDHLLSRRADMGLQRGYRQGYEKIGVCYQGMKFFSGKAMLRPGHIDFDSRLWSYNYWIYFTEMAEKYCICHGEAKGFMILCDVCEKLFHGSCVKLKRNSNLPEKWFCTQCSALLVRVEQLVDKEKEERIMKTDDVVQWVKQENEKLNARWNIEKDTIKGLESKCDRLSEDVQQILLEKEACKQNSQTDDQNSFAVVKFLKEENEKLSACLHEEKIKVNCMENKCHQLIEEKEEIFKQTQMEANKAAVTLQSLQEENKNVTACLNIERERIQYFERKCQQLIKKDAAQQMVQAEHSNDTAETQLLREENGTLTASLNNERKKNEQLVQENKILKEQVALLQKRKRLSLSQN